MISYHIAPKDQYGRNEKKYTNLCSFVIITSSPYIDQNPPPAQNITASSIITDVTITLSNKTTYDTFTSSTTITPKFSKMCKTIDICAVGGGARGDTGIYYHTYNGGYGAAGGYSNKLSIGNIESITMTIGAANNRYDTPSTSTISINGSQHTFETNIDDKAGGITNMTSDLVNHGRPGTNGFHIFGDTSLPIIGSSGGSGGYYHSNNYSPSMPFTLYGGNGGANAGSGGSATGYYDESVSSNRFSRKNGTDATGYGCGGGGGANVSGNGVNIWSGETAYSYPGKGKQGAAFIRYNFS